MSTARCSLNWILVRILIAALLLVSATLIVGGGIAAVTDWNSTNIARRVLAHVAALAVLAGLIIGSVTLYAIWPRPKADSENKHVRGDGPYR